MNQSRPNIRKIPYKHGAVPRRSAAGLGVLALLLLAGFAVPASAQEGNGTQDPACDPYYTYCEPEEQSDPDDPMNQGQPPSPTGQTPMQPQPTQSWETDCDQPRTNMQCNEFGSIAMPSQVRIRGEPVEVTATIELNTNLQNRGSRYFLFSFRNVTEDGSNPIWIQVTDFSTPNGRVEFTREDHKGAHEKNYWVDIVDLPVNQPITVTMLVGATDRGAYSLEALVMAFDRGYAPVYDSSGSQASLFSFTLLSVNESTGDNRDAHAGGGKPGFNIPGPTLGVALAAVAVAGIVAARRLRA
ncbi:MAG TPA: hypothetical protein VFH47_01390 [Candidatus Thermoplasmatota archaeon]|nr:hypothetical protein [Candidatus Thermoplasmatota archaeon]